MDPFHFYHFSKILLPISILKLHNSKRYEKEVFDENCLLHFVLRRSLLQMMKLSSVYEWKSLQFGNQTFPQRNDNWNFPAHQEMFFFKT